ncbi:conserved hypothetical protein, partial [Ixodes scapularis]
VERQTPPPPPATGLNAQVPPPWDSPLTAVPQTAREAAGPPNAPRSQKQRQFTSPTGPARTANALQRTPPTNPTNADAKTRDDDVVFAVPVNVSLPALPAPRTSPLRVAVPSVPVNG